MRRTAAPCSVSLFISSHSISRPSWARHARRSSWTSQVPMQFFRKRMLPMPPSLLMFAAMASGFVIGRAQELADERPGARTDDESVRGIRHRRRGVRARRVVRADRHDAWPR